MKRFYQTVEIITDQDLFCITLDTKHLRTPAKRKLEVTSRPLAEALAKEWEAQVEYIVPASMPFTRLVNSSLDGGAHRQEEVIADIARFATSDLLYYRVKSPENLALEQEEQWDPILSSFGETFGIYFSVTTELSFIPQPAETLAMIQSLIARNRSPFSLGALHSLTTLSGSIILALALDKSLIPADKAWELAHLDELYQERIWGKDEDAMARRNSRYQEFLTAAMILEWEKNL